MSSVHRVCMCKKTHIRNEAANNKTTCLIHSLVYNSPCTNFADNSTFVKLPYTLFSLAFSLPLTVSTSSFFVLTPPIRSFSRNFLFVWYVKIQSIRVHQSDKWKNQNHCWTSTDNQNKVDATSYISFRIITEHLISNVVIPMRLVPSYCPFYLFNE